MQNPHKWHFYLHYSCSIQNISLSLHPQFHAGDVCTSSAGVADILKRRLLRSVLTFWNFANFRNIRDLATIDVLRDVNYPSVPILVRFLRMYTYARAYFNYKNCTENTYIRRGLRVVGSNVSGNAKASKGGTGKCKFHAFFVVSDWFMKTHGWVIMLILTN